MLPSPSSPQHDRRRHQRKGGDLGDRGYFTVGGLPAQLSDWSFGDLGVALGQPAQFGVDDVVELRIYNPAQECWDTLSGQIRRVEADGTLGIIPRLIG